MKFSMTEHGFETTIKFGTMTISSNDDYGFRPYQLLVSSLAACSGGVLKKVLEKMRMPANNISIEVKDVIRNAEEANKVEKVYLHFIIEGEMIDDNKMLRAMELTNKNCAMVQSVAKSIEVFETYEVNKTK